MTNWSSVRRPNLVLMIADDHRYDALGCAGDPTVQTPCLDGLARRSVRFTHAYCQGGLTGAICAPSRACLMTGSELFHATAPRKVGARQPSNDLNARLATLPATLRVAGYHTHAVGKWHNDRASFTAGFASGDALFFGGMSDHWAVPVHTFDPAGAYRPALARPAYGRHSSELFADAAIDFLGGYAEEHPFFLYVAFTAPHDPRTAPAPYSTMYDPARLPLPPNVMAEPEFDNGSLEERDERLTPRPRSRETVRRHLADYFGMISHLDAQVGRILDALNAEDTFVIYVGDHGLAIGCHGFMGKQNLYDHSVRIPLMIGGPGLPPGCAVDDLCTLADLLPTVCQLLGVPTPRTVEGRSLLPLVTPSQATGRDHVFGAYRDLQRMATDGRHKLIHSYRSPVGLGTDRTQLFDLQDDPWEIRDLSSKPASAAIRSELDAVLARWRRQSGDPFGSR